MRLQVDDEFPEYYIEIEPSLYGLSFLSVAEEETTVHNLTRKQGIELIAMLMVNISPAPAQEEIDEAVARLIFSNLREAE